MRLAVRMAALTTLVLSACSTDETSPYFGATVREGKDPRTFYVNNVSEPEGCGCRVAGATPDDTTPLSISLGGAFAAVLMARRRSSRRSAGDAKKR